MVADSMFRQEEIYLFMGWLWGTGINVLRAYTRSRWKIEEKAINST